MNVLARWLSSWTEPQARVVEHRSIDTIGDRTNVQALVRFVSIDDGPVQLVEMNPQGITIHQNSCHAGRVPNQAGDLIGPEAGPEFLAALQQWFHGDYSWVTPTMKMPVAAALRPEVPAPDWSDRARSSSPVSTVSPPSDRIPAPIRPPLFTFKIKCDLGGGAKNVLGRATGMQIGDTDNPTKDMPGSASFREAGFWLALSRLGANYWELEANAYRDATPDVAVLRSLQGRIREALTTLGASWTEAP